MKRIVALLIVWLALGMQNVIAQKMKTDKLFGVTWLLTEAPKMVNEKQPETDKDIHLDFSKNGTWQSTQPFNGATSGKWNVEGDGRLLLYFTNKKYAVINELTDGHLQMVVAANGFSYIWKWEAAQ